MSAQTIATPATPATRATPAAMPRRRAVLTARPVDSGSCGSRWDVRVAWVARG
jgi:hypothetical protein